VNICQRLESLGKEIDPDADVITLMSDGTAAALDESFVTQSVGEFAVKGRVEPVEVFRLVG
jgi:adenylate cyclase